MPILAFAYSFLLARVAGAACSGGFAAVNANLFGVVATSGKADFQNPSEDYIEWNLTGCSEGPYRCDFLYYLAGGPRPLALLVNGLTVVSSLNFAQTGGWNVGSTVTQEVSLMAGSNTIKLLATGSNGGNFQTLTLTRVAACTKPSVTGYDLTACASTIARASWNPSCGSCTQSAGSVTHTVCDPSFTAWSVSGCQTTTTETTTTTTTTQAESIGNFSIAITMENAEEFVQEPNITFAMSRFVAILLGIEQAWIHDLEVTLIPAHRLLTSVGSQSGMRGNRSRRIMVITTKSGVDISFKVIIPPDGGPNQVTATVLIERFEQASITEAEDVIKQVVSSGILGSDDYEVEVLFKAVLPAETTTTLGSSIAKEDDMQLLVIFFASFTSIVCISLILCYTLRLHRKKRSVGEAQPFLIDSRRTLSTAWLMTPPDAISLDMKVALCMWITDMIDVVNPSVFVCFASGQRREDVDGCGPGLFYAALVISALHGQSIPCYCSLGEALEDNHRDNHCHQILSTENASCGMLLVVETAAFYSSIRCFEQVHSALKNNYSIFRIRFEYNPERHGYWPDQPLKEPSILKVKHELELRRTIPDGPIVQAAPQKLELFVGELNGRIRRSGTGSQFASSSSSGIPDEDVDESSALIYDCGSVMFGTARSEASRKSSKVTFAKSVSELGKGKPNKRSELNGKIGRSGTAAQYASSSSGNQNDDFEESSTGISGSGSVMVGRARSEASGKSGAVEFAKSVSELGKGKPKKKRKQTDLHTSRQSMVSKAIEISGRNNCKAIERKRSCRTVGRARGVSFKVGL